ncbi:MAG: hypothetical protein CSA95_03605 [Bacteroidetes bacterium]|nr:MAG: hypothetical protein CSA95_03605 [Bacteroidota bacterium]
MAIRSSVIDAGTPEKGVIVIPVHIGIIIMIIAIETVGIMETTKARGVLIIVVILILIILSVIIIGHIRISISLSNSPRYGVIGGIV